MFKIIFLGKEYLEKVEFMFSGAISVKIKTENHILELRSKARWLAEKIGLDAGHAGTLSVIVSELARLILSSTQTGRIDIVSITDKLKKGITVLAFSEELDRNEIKGKLYENLLMLNQRNFGELTASHVIDEFKVFPSDNRELIMQLTKWV